MLDEMDDDDHSRTERIAKDDVDEVTNETDYVRTC